MHPAAIISYQAKRRDARITEIRVTFERAPLDLRAIDEVELLEDDAAKAFVQFVLSATCTIALGAARPETAKAVAVLLGTCLKTPTESERGLRPRGT